MSDEIEYKNNPLHGLSLKNLLIEIVDHYGFEILYAYLNINCFKTKPSIESSVKFLKKTDWAREKVEIFYMYEFKNLPKASSRQFGVSPRDRIVPDNQKPGEPAELSLEHAEELREKRAKKTAERNKSGGYRSGKKSGTQGGGYSNSRGSSSRGSGNRDSDRRDNDNYRRDDRDSSSSSNTSTDSDVDPWAKWKK